MMHLIGSERLCQRGPLVGGLHRHHAAVEEHDVLHPPLQEVDEWDILIATAVAVVGRRGCLRGLGELVSSRRRPGDENISIFIASTYIYIYICMYVCVLQFHSSVCYEKIEAVGYQ